MPKRRGQQPDPQPGAYRPHVAARRPGAPPDAKPRFRVLVHRQYADAWVLFATRVGLENAQQFWDHGKQEVAGIAAVDDVSDTASDVDCPAEVDGLQ